MQAFEVFLVPGKQSPPALGRSMGRWKMFGAGGGQLVMTPFRNHTCTTPRHSARMHTTRAIAAAAWHPSNAAHL